MANPRILDRPLRQRSDDRYFVAVYPAGGGPGKRVYLGGKDGERANALCAAIKKPLGDGNLREVMHRLKCLERIKTWGILAAAQRWLDQDYPERAAQLEEYAETHDEDGTGASRLTARRSCSAASRWARGAPLSSSTRKRV